MQLFDATTLAPVGDPVRTGTNETSAVAWNPAGTQIATGNTDTLRLFDASSLAPIGEPVHTGASGTSAVAWNQPARRSQPATPTERCNCSIPPPWQESASLCIPGPSRRP